MKRIGTIFVGLVALAALAPGARAGTNRFTAEIISRSEPATTNLSRALWHPSGERVTYLRSAGHGTNARTALWAYELASAQEIQLFQPPRTTNAAARISLSSYQWNPAGDGLLVSGDGDLWFVSLPGGETRRLTRGAGAEEHATFSPDGRWIAFVRTNNLFAVDVADAREIQLTRDGSPLVYNGTLDWVYGEEFSHTGSSRAFEWSPDSRSLAFLRLDDGPVPEYPITDFLRRHPSVTGQRYPKAGDTNPRPAVCMVDIGGVRPGLRTMSLATNAEYVVPEFAWTPDTKALLVTTLDRAQTELRVHEWSGRRSDPARLLLRETDPAWLNTFEPPRFLRQGGQFLWLSERDGWLHCFLHDRDGWMRRQITRGPWQIEANFSIGWNPRPVEVDPRGDWLYFAATEKDPRERHVYRIRPDGFGLQRLTREPGTHFARLSPTGRHLLEQFSSTNQPPQIRILDTNGTVVATLEARSDRWRNFATAGAEFHEVIARDGTRLFGQLTTPADFDPARKYPVIVYVYGGPHAQVVRNQWPAVSTRHQLLAQEGFLVWSLDNRGSWGRGKAWESRVLKNLGALELADQLEGVRYLKSLPFVDTNRFGIWGWSYGGYMTLYALTHAPETFRCGVAGAPVTDWKYYDTIYTERYMKTPAENPGGYRTSSPLAAASKLRAKLLLLHGTADDNVHMQNSMNFLDALVKAGITFELQVQPGQKHGFAGEASQRVLVHSLVDFFQRNLSP